MTGLPAGLVLDRDAIDADLHRRQQGYGRSPRQKIETDRVEVLAGLRHGRTLGTPLALARRQSRPQELDVGDEPVAAGGRAGQGRARSPLRCRARATPTWPACSSTGSTDVRDALERASARHTAVFVAAGAVAKALLREIGVEVEGSVVGLEDVERRVDEARSDRDTVGGVVEVRARGVPPGLGSYASKDDRLDARLAAALMGIQAVKGVEIGDGFALAALRGSQAHDEIVAGPAPRDEPRRRASRPASRTARRSSSARR